MTNFDWKPVFADLNGTPSAVWEGSGVLHFGDSAAELAAAQGNTVVAPLAHYGLIACQGEDSTTFLHNQLTSDVNHLQQGKAQHAGWCSPKGRMLASFLVIRGRQGYRLRLSSELSAPIARRLAMFILRAKVAVADRSDAFAIIGLSGPQAVTALSAAALPVPAGLLEVAENDVGVTVTRVDAARFELLVPASMVADTWRLLATDATPVGVAAWRWLEVRSGIPLVTAATQEEFVPQMVNFDKIGGVSFNKGCYPGQEVVARTQYLGKVKRHLFRLVAQTEVAAGNPLFSEATPDHPCGIVVNAAPAPDGFVEALAVLQENAIGTAIRLHAPDGPVVSDISLVAN